MTITSDVDDSRANDIDPTSIHPAVNRPASQIETTRPIEKPTQKVAVTPVAVLAPP